MGGAPVVVGVDGSESALGAVGLAAREARLRGTGLRIVFAFIWPLMNVSLDPSAPAPQEAGLRHQADIFVDNAVRRAEEEAPGVAVEGAVVMGDVLPVMMEESRTAGLIVVGSRGRGAFTGLLLGSTAVHLTAHGHCPVLVARGESNPRGPVVVGVDGSPAGSAAIDFAFAEASWRGTSVRAVHGWSILGAPPPVDPVVMGADPKGTFTDTGERLLAEVLAGRVADYPEVRVDRTVTKDGPRQALIEASRDAALVVTGARGRGGFAGLLLGSVSQALLHHAHSPVAVVRGEG
ncbi:Universal stress protein [Streptomyces sp. RB5]|uniref:Universal stress protein n=1 Tax=Streptomyces smaragdinus TaxID=2585196 RepID=A0A7K0CGV1_9ACTN|nr:universal stress protein [Streptomyces smaragdinus]MQY12606.1 Universal stress protein [Streptomyces smaragdinus]